MNIIFGREQARLMENKYTVLELDTFKIGPTGPEVTAFCTVENLPITDLPKVEQMKNLHNNLIIEYSKRNWKFCTDAIDILLGFWGHQLDTFYDDLRNRVNNFQENAPSDDWTPIIQKSAAP